MCVGVYLSWNDTHLYSDGSFLFLLSFPFLSFFSVLFNTYGDPADLITAFANGSDLSFENPTFRDIETSLLFMDVKTMTGLGKQSEKDLIGNQQEKGLTTQATELLV